MAGNLLGGGGGVAIHANGLSETWNCRGTGGGQDGRLIPNPDQTEGRGGAWQLHGRGGTGLRWHMLRGVQGADAGCRCRRAPARRLRELPHRYTHARYHCATLTHTHTHTHTHTRTHAPAARTRLWRCRLSSPCPQCGGAEAARAARGRTEGGRGREGQGREEGRLRRRGRRRGRLRRRRRRTGGASGGAGRVGGLNRVEGTEVRDGLRFDTCCPPYPGWLPPVRPGCCPTSPQPQRLFLLSLPSLARPLAPPLGTLSLPPTPFSDYWDLILARTKPSLPPVPFPHPPRTLMVSVWRLRISTKHFSALQSGWSWRR